MHCVKRCLEQNVEWNGGMDLNDNNDNGYIMQHCLYSWTVALYIV